MFKMEEPIFPSLRGIRPGREVRQRNKSNLERLLGLCDDIIEAYADKVDIYRDSLRNDIYLKIMSKISRTTFDVDDLKSFIFSTTNKEYELRESITLGLYTGCLLHLLTRRNRRKKERTQFYINGHGNRFDYLFHYAKEVDELVVDNFKGNKICSYVGTHGGCADIVLVMNSKGDGAASGVGSERGKAGLVMVVNNGGNNPASRVGSHGGKAGLVMVVGNTGKESASYVGYRGGNVDLVVVLDNKGDEAASWCGYDKGHVHAVMVKNNDGADVAGAVGYGGYAHLVIIEDSKGDSAASGMSVEGGSVYTVLLKNVESEYVCTNLEHSRVVAYNVTASWIARYSKFIEIIKGTQAQREYQSTTKRYKFGEIISLAKSMKSKTDYREILEDVRKIDSIYQKVKLKL